MSLSISLSLYLSIYLQAWKRSYSARLPQFLNLTTSNTQQFSETSSIFALDNIKNKAILRHFLFFKLPTSKTKLFCGASFRGGELSAELTASYQCVLRFFRSICTFSEPCALYILTWKCASCHNGVRFFDVSTSKSGPRPSVFNTFDLEMCFAPQLRALFRHLNFQKSSDVGVFCSCWLGNMLRATTACNFSSLIWPHGSAPLALASLLFRPSGATNHWKNTMNRDFPTFSDTFFFFLLSLSLLWSSLFGSSPLRLFPPLLFHLSILSEVWLLNFLRQSHISPQLRCMYEVHVVISLGCFPAHIIEPCLHTSTQVLRWMFTRITTSQNLDIGRQIIWW